MKISIIGAGNVGGLAAMRLAEYGLGSIVLIDPVGGLAKAKALDIEDSAAVAKYNYHIEGSEDICKIEDSDIVVITAGFARKPGMTREDLLLKNGRILNDICLNIKNIAKGAIVIVVTNPLDLMTRLALKITGFSPKKVFGTGLLLDAARFSNLISLELNIPNNEIEPCVIASHGEGMLPLPRFTTIRGVPLDKFLDKDKIKELLQKTILRGAEIVSLLGSGSAYFAPSQAISTFVKAIVKDEKRVIGVSAYLNGEYGIRGACIGAPCRIGAGGIEEIIELDLSQEEKAHLAKTAASLNEQFNLHFH